MYIDYNAILVVVLAAGHGKRMFSDHNVPKVLNTLAGYPMLQYVVDAVEETGIKNIVGVIPPNCNGIFNKIFEKYITVVQNERLGTAKALACITSDLLHNIETVLVLYGDTPLINKHVINKLLLHHMKNKSSVTVAGFLYEQDNSYGRLLVENNSLIGIVESKDASKEQEEIELCNSGIMAIKNDDLLHNLSRLTMKNGEYYLTDLVDLLYREDGKYCSFVIADQIELLGVNNFHELDQCEAIVQYKIRNRLYNSGVKIINGTTVYFSWDIKIGSGSVIYPFNFFGRNVKIGDKTIIKSFSNINECNIGNNCSIGPYAYLRPENSLADNVKIGSFVELKKSHLDSKSKVAHLSYIGDAEIGTNVNIGAGVITCNYDGKNKYKTIIGNNVFIGSNSSLIAPLTLENDVFIGAGSVITQDVEEKSLAVARNKQKNIKNWNKK